MSTAVGAGVGVASSNLVLNALDEFVLLCSMLASAADADQLRRRILDAFEVPILIDGVTLNVSVSVGTACSTDLSATLDDMLREADLSMYEHKPCHRMSS